MKQLIVLIFSLFLLYGCNGMAYSSEPILELKATAGLKIEVVNEDGIQYLKVSGVPTFSSTHGVKTVDQIAEDRAIVIMVKLTTGSDSMIDFSEKIELRNGVTSVLFGSERVEIWSDKEGVIKEVLQKYTGSVI